MAVLAGVGAGVSGEALCWSGRGAAVNEPALAQADTQQHSTVAIQTPQTRATTSWPTQDGGHFCDPSWDLWRTKYE